MPPGQLRTVVHHLRRMVGPAASARLSDRQLLKRFAATRDEAAFATLLERHGPLVWGVCQRRLRHVQDAEDAFQATFLVLARKAATERWRASVGNWLYEVASRLAAEARTKNVRRRQHELRAGQGRAAESDPNQHELCSALDEELQGLPNKYRVPLLLCYLQGQTSDQAADVLGWSLRTLQRRLAEGRELLRARLTRRGLTLSAALLVPVVTQDASAGAPALLSVVTVRAATLFAAGVGETSSTATALAEGVLKGMAMTRLKLLAVLFIALSTTAGAGVLVSTTAAARNPALEPDVHAAAPNDPARAPSNGPSDAQEAKPKDVPFANRVWVIMDLVAAKHIKPPSRQQMILAGVQGLLKAGKAKPPDDLEDRVAKLTTREQYAAFLKTIWPAGADVPPTDKLEAALIQEMLANLPGQAHLLTGKEALVNEQIEANRYVGIGVQLRLTKDDKVPVIVTPFVRGPARKAGIKPGDLMLEVNGKSTRGVPLADVIDCVRGKEGTPITLVVQSPGDKEPRTVKMNRGIVPFESVVGYRRPTEETWDYRSAPDSKIAYVRISALRSSTLHELRQVERRLRADGMRAVVLDVRNSGGGQLHNAALVAAALLDGQVMWSERTPGDKLKECRAGRECLFRDWPLVVLINEMVGQSEGAIAAALQDQRDAILVGETTRLGGLIRTTLPLPDGQGALSILTGRLERSNKERGWPLKPDHEVKLDKKQYEALDAWFGAKLRTDNPTGDADKPPADPQRERAVELLSAALKAPAKLTDRVGEEAVAILSGATRVEVFSMSTSSQQDREDGIGGYALVSKGKDQGKKFAGELVDALFRLRDYRDGSDSKKGHLLPVVGLRLWKKKDYVEVLIAAGDEVGVYTRDRKRFAFADSKAVRAALFRLASKALPGDKYVKEHLKEK
jgi:C-terminal peptidase prc